MVSTTEDSPGRQLLAAWQVATAVAAEWAERTAAVRAVGETWRTVTGWPQRDCECACAASHPKDLGVCDHRAVITRRLPVGRNGGADVPLCAPCAVAQGVAEMPG